mgnify:CR=1 FL=1|tara:strand:- start:317 stop:826 length:510 start_codon:yes stop_codon:yes gene_type:complete
MDKNVEIKQEPKNKFIQFYNQNKIKFLVLIFLIILIAFSIIFINQNNKKKNEKIAEKYVQAGIYLSNNKEKEATIMFEEIILNKNKFYSILALNTIIEKNLIKQEEKILNYFEILENLNYSDEKSDLITFKKALFFMKISKDKEGKELLKKLIKNKSKLKKLAEEIILN